jgi:mono/diheme cytochrome c family protein
MMIKKLLLTPLFLGFAVVSLHAEENAAGKAAYAICAACHGPDGKGVAIGDKKMAASLAGSKVVNGNASVMALAVMKGIKQEGTAYMVPMAPLEALFTDDAKFAALLTYVRQSFGNTASAVTAEEVAKFRTKWADQKEPVTRAKLQELSK